MYAVETRGHGDIGLEQASDGTFGFCGDRGIDETRLRDVRNVGMDVELDVREGPAAAKSSSVAVAVVSMRCG